MKAPDGFCLCFLSNFYMLCFFLPGSQRSSFAIYLDPFPRLRHCEALEAWEFCPHSNACLLEFSLENLSASCLLFCLQKGLRKKDPAISVYPVSYLAFVVACQPHLHTGQNHLWTPLNIPWPYSYSNNLRGNNWKWEISTVEMLPATAGEVNSYFCCPNLSMLNIPLPPSHLPQITEWWTLYSELLQMEGGKVTEAMEWRSL